MTRYEKRMLMAAAATFSLAVLIFGITFLMNNNFFRAEQPHLGLSFAAPSKRNAVLEQIRVVREKLRPWAEKRKNELKPLFEVDSTDEQALRKMWNISPVLITQNPDDPTNPFHGDSTITNRDVQGQVVLAFFCGYDRLRSQLQGTAKRSGYIRPLA